MQLASLRAYCLLVETGSFSEAAEKHGVTASAISQTLARLEKTWDARLVTRGRHGIGEMIPAGKVAYGVASDLVRQAGELHRAMRHACETPDGIWQSPAGARVAWFHDPDENILSLTEFPEP